MIRHIQQNNFRYAKPGVIGSIPILENTLSGFLVSSVGRARINVSCIYGVLV